MAQILRLLFIISCWLSQTAVWAKQVDVTVDDTDPSIQYSPAAIWKAATVPNADPNDLDSIRSAINGSYHNATVPMTDDPATSSSAAPAPTQTDTDGDGGNDADEGKQKGKTQKGPSRRRFSSRRALSKRFDSDDAPVTAQFSFNGTAVTLFAIQPSTTLTNLTFTLDNDSTFPPFVHTPASGAASFHGNTSVFTQQNLDDGPHTLLVTVGPGSTFLFDYMVYTTIQADDTAPDSTITISTTPTSSGAPSTPSSPAADSSPTMDPSMKRHNVATFGAAVGGTVGVLAVFAMGLAFSIIRRRRRAARRDRADRESLHTNASEDTPVMTGPRPFIPRYFPGTVVPRDPPAYMDSISPLLSTANHLQTPLLATAVDGDTSYADIAPPVQLDDGIVIPSVAPPPFPTAIATPPPALLVDGEDTNLIPPTPPPGLAESEQGSDESSSCSLEPLVSHADESVGPANQSDLNIPVVSVSQPESVALPPSRARSRASSQSSSRDYALLQPPPAAAAASDSDTGSDSNPSPQS